MSDMGHYRPISTEAFQMKEHHLELLSRNRSYLLHNLCPGEIFWGALLEMGVFDMDMLDEMKSQRTRTERVGMLLDLLPHRGPEAFDAFLEALLKCGHGFVADYLKILEVSDQFKTDIKLYNISDHIQDRLIRTYKKSLPNVQRFFETKLEVNLQEQESEFQDKEREISDLEHQTQTLESKIQETTQWFSNCVRRTHTLGNELKRSYILRSSLREERKNLEALYEKASADDKHEQLVSKFCDSMYSIIDYIEISEDRKALLEHRLNCGDDDDDSQQNGTNGKTITSKVQNVIDLVTTVMEKTVGMDIKDIDLEKDIRTELEKTVSKMREIIKDLSYVKRIFLTTLRKKEDLSQETLSLVHNFREIRRLEKEMTEKQDHIQELRTRGQTIKNKSKRHKRFLEQIQEEISQKEKQLTELYDHLQKQVNSADQRVHFILSLLPDSGEADGPHTLADDTKSEGGFSLLSRDLTYISIAKDRSDSRFSLQSEKTDVTIRATSCSTPAPPKTPAGNNDSNATIETKVVSFQKGSKDTVDNKPKSAVDSSNRPVKSALKSDNNAARQPPKTPNSSTTALSNQRSQNQQKPKTLTNSLKDSQSSTTSSGSASARKSPSPPGSAKNKVHPSPVTQVTPATPNPKPASPPPAAKAERSSQGLVTQKPESKQESNERQLSIGNITSSLGLATELIKDEETLSSSTASVDNKQQTNLIKVKPAEGVTTTVTTTIHTTATATTKSAKIVKPEDIRKSGSSTQPMQRHYQTKPPQERTPSQPISKFSASTERFPTKSTQAMEPLSISSARSNTNVDGKSPGVGEKSPAYRSPVPTPRFTARTTSGKFDPSVLMTDRPVAAPRSKRMSTSDEKDLKTTNGSATPHLPQGSQPPGVSSKPLLRPQTGDMHDSLLASSTFPPKKAKAKSMDHVMLGTRPMSQSRHITQNESVYSRVSEAINKVKDKTLRANNTKKEQTIEVNTGVNGTISTSLTSMTSLEGVSMSNLNNQRLSLSTESSEGQIGDLWLQSSSSDDGNALHDGTVSEQQTNRTEVNNVGLDGNTMIRGNSTCVVSQQQVTAELDLESDKLRKARTMSADTHASGRSRQVGEDPNKYPQRQVLMANKVQLK